MTFEIKKLTITYRGEPLELEYALRPGTQETILYLHGLGCSKADFCARPEETEVFQDMTLIAMDFPGHGGSSYPTRGALDMEDLVEITHLFLHALGISSLTLIGHSMGGIVAVLYAHKYPAIVKALINVEGNLKPEDCFFSRQAMTGGFSKFKDTTLKKFVDALEKSRHPGYHRYAQMLMDFPMRVLYNYCPSIVDQSDNGKLFEKFVTLPIPAFFIYGSDNKHLSYLSVLKKSAVRIAEISQSNHFPQYDNPREFYKVVAEFISPGLMHRL